MLFPGLPPPVMILLSPYPPNDPPTCLPLTTSAPRLLELSFPCSGSELFDFFRPCGALATVRSLLHGSQLTAIIEFWREDDSRKAEDKVHRTEIDGHIKFQICQPRGGTDLVGTLPFALDPPLESPNFGSERVTLIPFNRPCAPPDLQHPSLTADDLLSLSPTNGAHPHPLPDVQQHNLLLAHPTPSPNRTLLLNGFVSPRESSHTEETREAVGTDDEPFLTVCPAPGSPAPLNSNTPAWKRLCGHPSLPHEVISLVNGIFTSKDELKKIFDLRGDDAQTFVDVIHKV